MWALCPVCEAFVWEVLVWGEPGEQVMLAFDHGTLRENRPVGPRGLMFL